MEEHHKPNNKFLSRQDESGFSSLTLWTAVVLGGIQPTALPEEAIKHTDSVVIGEDEGCWEKAILASE